MKKFLIYFVVVGFVINAFCKMVIFSAETAMAESSEVFVANEMSDMGESSNLNCCWMKINNESDKSPETKVFKEIKQILETATFKSVSFDTLKNRAELQYGFNYLNNSSAPPKLTGQIIKNE